MDKKHISIIGSCVSRNLFNNTLMKEIFEVDRYAYHICPWDLFGESLNVDKGKIANVIKEEFTARMICYDLNKITINEFEKVNSEYFLMDFYSFVAAPIQKIKYDGRVCYSQNTCFRYYNFENMKNSILNIEIAEYNNLKNYIDDGLKKFASWIKEHYELNKVVIYVPTLADRYINSDGNLVIYDDYATAQALLSYIKKVSYEFRAMLDNKANILDLSEMDAVAQFGIYDNPSKLSRPPKMHLTNYNYIKQAKSLLDLLKIDYDNQLFNSLIVQEKNYSGRV